MSELRDLYQEVIVDHCKRPRNFHPLQAVNRQAEGYNPLCGDKITVFLNLEDDVVRDISFQGFGCAISTAAASLMTESLKGKTRAEAETLFEGFHALVTGEERAKTDLGKLAVFGGVREFPVRVKCATLPWHTLRAALNGSRKVVATE